VTPSGDRVVFASGRDDTPEVQREVYTVGMDGQGLTQLTHHEGNVSYQPAVSPDGEKIAYVVEDPGRSDIHVMNADGSGDVNITRTMKGYWEPQWTPDGKSIVVSTYDTQRGNLELVKLAADGSGKQQITRFGAATSSAVVSPDGSHLVFGVDPAMGSPILASSDSDGHDVHRYAPGLVLAGTPALSKDGTIAFCGIDDERHFDIYTTKLDGDGKATRIESSGAAFAPTFSPDGSHLAWVGNDGHGFVQVYEANADGSDVHALTHDNAVHASPTYSPDGRSLVYLSDADGKFEVYRQPLE
jgi:TolB protein